MKIGVVADTHLREGNEYLRRISEKFFSDADIILHAGDLVSTKVLAAFGEKDIRAVRGNMDVDESLPEKLLLEIEGVKIGLIHGWGMPMGLEAKLLREFDEVDCLVYGHTHIACNHLRDGVLFFNPGSPTDRRFAPVNTIGLLEIRGKRIEGRIEEINRKEFL